MVQVARALLRLVFVLLNNAYCIPTYVLWMVCLMPFRKLLPGLYWRVEGYFYHWLLAMVSMWSWTAGYDSKWFEHECEQHELTSVVCVCAVAESGDDITLCTGERTLVLANHQSTADVPLLMAAFNPRPALLPNLTWIMDRLFKYTNFGIVSVLHQDFFIVSGREQRARSVRALQDHIRESFWPRGRRWLVLFPEGGFLRKRRESSRRYAQRHGLPLLQHVSLPRVGAMQAILETMPGDGGGDADKEQEHEHVQHEHRLRWVLDVTIAYSGGRPLDLAAIVLGTRSPCTTLLHYRLFPADELPRDAEEQATWLYSRFQEKELLLDRWYREARLPHGEDSRPPRPVRQDPLRYLLLHVFFLASTYLHWRLLSALAAALLPL